MRRFPLAPTRARLARLAGLVAATVEASALTLPGLQRRRRGRAVAGTSTWQRVIAGALGRLERLAFVCPLLQRALVRVHARAIVRLLPRPVPAGLRIAVIGGGLFPRSALALARVCPHACVTIVDADAGNLELARRWLADRGLHGREFVCATWDPRAAQSHDLVIVPLALVGDRAAVYSAAGPARLIHDWLWRRRGRGVVVSWLLLKRINLVAAST
jgi:hypothetical protein